MAFSKLSESEWRDYLHYRKVQGFNVVQVSLFPLDHDNSADENELLPFMKMKMALLIIVCGMMLILIKWKR